MAYEMGSLEGPRPPASEVRLAWSATVVLALYSCWVGFVGFQQLPTLVGLHAGLGIEEPLPVVLAFFSRNPWFFLLMFVAIASALVFKEMIVLDKRRSIMITCLVAVFLMIVVDVSRIMITEPILELFLQLS